MTITTPASQAADDAQPGRPAVADHALPGAAGAVGAAGVGAVTALLGASGWQLIDSRPVQALYRPGRSLVVRHAGRALIDRGLPRRVDVCVETRTEAASGPLQAEPDPHYGLVPALRHGPYLAWVYPFDPGLPALPDAAWPARVRDDLRARGPTRRVQVATIGYRPRRRAVLRYRFNTPNGRRILYAKVLRTRRARQLRALAEQLPAATGRARLALPKPGPTPTVLLYEPLAGRALAHLLVAGGPLPRPERIAGVIDAVAACGAGIVSPPAARRHRAPLDAALETAALLERLVPQERRAIAAVVAAVDRGSQNPHPPGFVHGDLHDRQVLVDEDFSLGLLDLDDAGIGDPAMDVATFSAHLLAFAMVAGSARTRILAYRTALRWELRRHLDLSAPALAWREALVMLQLATGPFRVLHPSWPARVAARVRLAARLLEPDRPAGPAARRRDAEERVPA